MQDTVNKVKNTESPDLIVLLSHNGIDVDKKMANRVNGIDIILGGHTHDAMPEPVIENSSSQTIVVNSGCNGKFVSMIDINFSNKSYTYNYKLIPIISNKIRPDVGMQSYINKISSPYNAMLNTEIGKTDEALFRRSNFNGTFDDLICDSMNNVLNTEISLSPGFRWGPTLTKNQPILMKDIYNHTAITYPNTYVGK